MNDFFDNLIKEGVTKVTHDGKNFFLLTPSVLRGSVIEIISNDGLDQNEKMSRVLALSLCDESGKLCFDVNNQADLEKIKSIPNKYLVPLIEELTTKFFGVKKK